MDVHSRSCLLYGSSDVGQAPSFHKEEKKYFASSFSEYFMQSGDQSRHVLTLSYST